MTVLELVVILFLAYTAYTAAVACLVYWIMNGLVSWIVNRPKPPPW